MAEGWLRKLAAERFDVSSAGSKPAGLNPLAVRVMAERDVDISAHQSKSVDVFAGQKFDFVITVCDNARQSCPVFPGEARRLHWNLEDPAAAEGSEEQRLAIFRRVRDEIEQHVRVLLVSIRQ